MIVGIHQPNYLPWLAYFRKIADADRFVFFDNVQMPIGKSLISRNRIKTAQGVRWLTVPTHRDSTGASISDTPVANGPWPRKHQKTIEAAYAGSPWLAEVLDRLDGPLATADDGSIADLNIAIIRSLAQYLELGDTELLRATDMNLQRHGADSIGEILEQSGATVYLTGAGVGSMRYLDETRLRKQGVETRFLDPNFAAYPQRHGDFVGELSILDALLNRGPEQTRALIVTPT
jgi:hypothetical protein